MTENIVLAVLSPAVVAGAIWLLIRETRRSRQDNEARRKAGSEILRALLETHVGTLAQVVSYYHQVKLIGGNCDHIMTIIAMNVVNTEQAYDRLKDVDGSATRPVIIGQARLILGMQDAA